MSNWTQADLDALEQRRKHPEAVSMPVKVKGVHKHTPGEPNKTEQRYLDHLKLRKIAGEIVWYAFEVVKFRLAKATYFTPDVLVMLKDGTLEAHECKTMTRDGKLLITDDANVKLKMAAELFPIVFRRMAYEPNTGEWIEREIGRKAA